MAVKNNMCITFKSNWPVLVTFMQHRSPFDELKNSLIKAVLPNFAEHFIYETDASGLDLGAVLSQKQPDKMVAPTAYSCCTL